MSAPEQDTRPMPPQEAGELSTLLGFLDFQRSTTGWRCARLSDAQLAVGRPPSAITLGGLLVHLAWVEDYWFTVVVGGRTMPEPWAPGLRPAEPVWAPGHRLAPTGADAWALWTERTARSRAVVDAEVAREGESAALAVVHPAWDGQGQVSLRWVLVHMVEEYARHNGHADVLREALDGETGE